MKIRLQVRCVLVSFIERRGTFVPQEEACGRDYGWNPGGALGPSARRTIARIDRLNYRDIGVIKAPLC